MIDDIEMEDYICDGPLTLCRQERLANTVMGTELSLEDKTFDALDILASREGETFTLKQLATDIWGGDSDAAWLDLANLAEQVNSVGHGFMQIDYSETTGYTFKTQWATRL